MYGISADSPFALGKWAEQEGYSFPLLSDFGKATCRAYGALYPELIGLQDVPKRGAFIVDRDGRLTHAEVLEDAGQLPDVNALIDRIIEMP